MIRFACPGCSSTFSVDDAKAGKSGKCPKCQAQFIIPQLEAAPAEVAPPPLPAPAPPAPAPAPVPVPVSVQPQPPAADPNAPVEIDPCPKCQTKLSVTVADLGNDVECPYCKTVFKSVKAGTRPPAPPAPPGKKSSFETDFSSRPKAKRKDDDEDDDRPRKRRRDDDDEDDRPSKRRRKDDDDDDRPSRRGRAAASSRRDDDDDDDRPSRRRSSRRDDDDDDDDYDDRPRRRSRSGGRSRGGSGHRSGAVTAVGVITTIFGALTLLAAAALLFGGAFIYSMIGGVPRQGMNADGRAVVEGVQTGVTAVFMCVGIFFLAYAIFQIMAGIFCIQRKNAGRIMVIICAALALIGGLFNLYGALTILQLPFVTTGMVVQQLVSLTLTLGYGIFAMMTMCRSDYADEFS